MAAGDKSVRVILTASTAGFMAEIRKAQAAASGLATQLGKASMSQEWKTAGTAIGVVGLALTAAVGLAVKAWADFDQQMSAVAATGDDARKNLDALREAAIQAGADTKYSATEAAAGVEALLKAGVSSVDVLGGGLTGALNLAAAGNLGVADSAEVAATAMTQFKLKGTDVGHIADLLAAGAGKAQGEVSDMAAALKQAGLVSSQAGISIEETTGTLAAFASAGLIGSDAGTSYRTMLMALMNPTKEAAGLLSQLGINTYDASGKFVTMQDLAGQLQSKMGGLDEATRNAALSTIFGSDAIRGANVLYTNGAQGIADWTAAVDDQGYAAEVAATKMDNLKGDIEQFTGSLDTLMISAGSASGGALRSLVQQLTQLVNLAGRHPEVTQGVAAVVLALGGFALVTAGVMKTVTAVTELRTTTALLNKSAPGLTTNIRKWSDAAAKAAVALAIASAAAQALSNNAAMPGVTEGEAALSALATSAGSSTAALDKMFQDATGAWGSTDLVYGVDSLDSALHRVANQNIGDDFFGLGAKLMGNKSELELVTAQVGKLDTALTQMNPTNARDAFAKIGDAAQAQGMSVEKLLTLFPEYKAELEKTATSLGVYNLSAQEYVDWMGGKIPPAIQAATAAAKDAKVATDGYSSALTDQELVVKNAAQAEADLAKSLTDTANAALDASGAAISYQASLDAATESIGKNGKTLDINTEAGRANRTALDDVASSARKSAQANADAGASNDALSAQMVTARAEFIKTAGPEGMGMTIAAAEALADKYGLVPGTVKTNVESNAVDVAKNVQDLLIKIASLPPSQQASIVATMNTQGFEAGKAAYDAVKNKTVTVDVNYRASNDYGPGSAGYNVGRATGGPVWGPGTGTSDSIPVRLSNGEYVIRASAAAQYRSLLDAINSGARIPGFRDGGLVSTTAPAYSSSTAVTVGSPNVSLQVLIDGQEVRHIVRSEMNGVSASAGQLSRQMGAAS